MVSKLNINEVHRSLIKRETFISNENEEQKRDPIFKNIVETNEVQSKREARMSPTRPTYLK